MTETISREILLNKIESVQNRLANVPGVSLRELQEISQRLKRNDYLVAVFGAFSAGKSSLLNALIGESVLTVSPNPTTASVTQLQSPLENNQAQVVVTTKTEEELWRDVASAFAALHESPSTLDAGIKHAAGLNAKDYPTGLRRHIRFLKAIYEGYESMQGRLGSTWTTTLDELQSFSAVEKYAAYVARVDVHADHPWLRKGFIFVDTPGVDSIHRRHTDVAFRYMRHADAVIFVMYYTHAFTQGDRDFLLQLSGVQDVAKTNKLFAVLNAVDLAKSEEERAAVRERVTQEMRRLGVHQPRVYEVSSQLGLAGRRLADDPSDETYQEMARARLKLAADESLPTPEAMLEQSGIRALETDLRRYVEEEGNTLAADMVERAVKQLADGLSRSIADEKAHQEADDTAQAERLARLENVHSEIARDAARDTDADQSTVLNQFVRELDELTFHAAERIRLRYRDLFREAFQPGRFRLGKASEKLQEAAEELCDSLARQVDIETRTLSLRAASLAEQSARRLRESWRDRLQSNGVHGLAQGDFDFSDIVVESVQANIRADILRPFYRHFSSPRQFFEGGGQREMMDASESEIVSIVRQALQDSTESVKSHAVARLQQAISETYQALTECAKTAMEDAKKPFDAAKLQRLMEAQSYLQELTV
ncbi:dynamin family protein [Alicyclobacillus dauci]|uniref:Dynamin family protein n=1 Tax=Alicyclobacillus dauci TaxID=1475485 RepID=A0ABY6YZF6_9BACL|nr:dynamin family protein [Alicyclobacillus dauci]WAH35842.1 dynamin family protein [Alicyclobacillus dauci]